MTYRSRLAGLCLFAALATSVSAETAAEVRGKKIIDDAIAALGGDKFLKMEDRIESGRAYSLYLEELSGLSTPTIYPRYITVAEGKTGEDLGIRERQALGKNEEYGYTLFREDGAWEVPFRGGGERPHG